MRGPDGKSGEPVFATIPQSCWGVFVTGIGEFTDVDSSLRATVPSEHLPR